MTTVLAGLLTVGLAPAARATEPDTANVGAKADQGAAYQGMPATDTIFVGLRGHGSAGSGLVILQFRLARTAKVR